MRRRSAVMLALVWLAACGGGGSRPAPPPLKLGDPNPGLTAQQLLAFERGREVFEHRFKRSEGHGPHFNVSSCASCHEVPVAGGSSPLYRNFFLVGRRNGAVMDPVLEDGQLVARLFSYERVARETIPATADIVAQRNAPPMFGMGELARIPAQDIMLLQDPSDLDMDNISGRVNFDNGAVGRFGFKAQAADLEAFVRGPIFNHLGITTDPLPPNLVAGPLRAQAQVSAPGQPTTDNDGVPDPELPEADLADLVFFTQELAPPQPSASDAETAEGRQLFTSVGCAKCHVPNVVRDGDPVFAYTDLLVHDMGPALADGVLMNSATGSEFRTQPLWGLRHHAPFLHDGRADTIEEAILLHGGEAAGIRDVFAALPGAEKQALMRFLETR